jgi:lysozyme
MSVKQRLAAAGLSASLVLAGGTLIAPWEGKENAAYKDIVGVWTQCYGNTNNVDRNKPKTDDQCTDELAKELVNYNAKMKKYVHVPMTTGQEAAFTSFVYNVGEGTWQRGTPLKLLNSGKYTEACQYLMRYNKAGGKSVAGLTNRRKAEMEVCLGNNKQAIDEANRIFESYKDGDYIDIMSGGKL